MAYALNTINSLLLRPISLRIVCMTNWKSHHTNPQCQPMRPASIMSQQVILTNLVPAMMDWTSIVHNDTRIDEYIGMRTLTLFSSRHLADKPSAILGGSSKCSSSPALQSSFQTSSSIYLVYHVHQGLDLSFTLTMAPMEMTQASPLVALAQQSTPLSSPSLLSSTFQNSVSTAQLGLLQTMPSNSQIAIIASIAFIVLWSVNRLRVKIQHRSILMIS